MKDCRGISGKLFGLLVLAVFGFIGCSHPHRSQTSGVSAKQDYTRDACRWADSVIDVMTPAQMVGQLFMPAVYAEGSAENIDWLVMTASRYALGGVVLLRGDTAGAHLIADTLFRLSPGLPAFIAVDAETGLSMRLSDAPSMPVASSLGKTADGQRMYDYGRVLASQCASLGVNMVLGPVLDVECDADGFIGRRSYGADPQLVAELGVSFARGLEDGGVVSVAKHFPGHGSAEGDSHRQLPVIMTSLRHIEKEVLPPFREYIDAGLSSVMVGHLAVPAIDSRLRSAALSPSVIADLLRGDLGFQGVVMTDALNMDGASGIEGTSTSVQALLAGADIILAPYNLPEEIKAVQMALADGTLTESRLRESLRRILLLKYRLRL